MSLAYHRSELRIAQDPSSPFHSLPPLESRYRKVLDVGCGMGQSLIGLRLPEDVEGYGVDVDREAVEAGRHLVPQNIKLLQASGEQLPFDDGTFDLVFSRVSMPYMHVSRALREASRVLKRGGDFWGVFHSFRYARKKWTRAVTNLNVKEATFSSYVIVNGIILHVTGMQFAFPLLGVQESFQTEAAVRRALAKAGLAVRLVEYGPLKITACKQ